ncbi:hypothetical protein N9L68_06985 [bacterium]|nr:hypothetical protein [bacterium]
MSACVEQMSWDVTTNSDFKSVIDAISKDGKKQRLDNSEELHLNIQSAALEQLEAEL